MTISTIISMKILTKSKQPKDLINMVIWFNKRPNSTVEGLMKNILNHFLKEKIKRLI